MPARILISAIVMSRERTLRTKSISTYINFDLAVDSANDSRNELIPEGQGNPSEKLTCKRTDGNQLE